MTQPLITPAQLNELLKQQDIILLDASIEFQIPGEAQKITDQYIPGTIKFDYDKDFCNKHTLLPHMFLPRSISTSELEPWASTTPAPSLSMTMLVRLLRHVLGGCFMLWDTTIR